VLDEDFDTESWVENEDCGCWVAIVVIDGAEVEAHHWIPDDTAPHVPDPECGCGPVIRDDTTDGVVLLYEHRDQEDPAGLREELMS
jgi:hypothetical protein